MAGLRSLPRASLYATASLGALGASSWSSRVYAEERVGSPLYPSAASNVTLVPVETELQKQVGTVRRSIEAGSVQARDALFAWVNRWIHLEHTIEQRAKSLVPASEPVVPGLLYVGVATLAGSIYGRYRSLPVRLLAPPVAFLASMAYFQPGLSTNLVEYYKELEGRHLPAVVAEQRTAAEKQWASARHATTGITHDTARTLGSWWNDSLVSVQNATGLTVAPHAPPARASDQPKAVESPAPAPAPTA